MRVEAAKVRKGAVQAVVMVGGVMRREEGAVGEGEASNSRR